MNLSDYPKHYSLAVENRDLLNDTDGEITEKSINYSKELNRQTVAKQITNPGVMRVIGNLQGLIDDFSDYPEQGTRAVRVDSESAEEMKTEKTKPNKASLLTPVPPRVAYCISPLRPSFLPRVANLLL